MSNKTNNIKLTSNISENIDIIKSIFNDNESIIYKNFQSAAENSIKFCVIFSKNLCDIQGILENILKPIMLAKLNNKILPEARIDYVLDKIIFTCDNNKLKDSDVCTNEILNGHAVLFLEGCIEAISISSELIRERTISEPDSNKVTRGPKEGFTESMETNVALIQQRVHSSYLKIKYRTLGVQTKTKICIIYMENLASEKILRELERRIGSIDIDGILDSHYIEELITDAPLSIFSTTGYTDRPDIVSAKLLEGRIALISDGSPDVLTLPFLLLENFQSNEDYYKEFSSASFYRILRYVAFIFTTCTPAIYLSMVTYHQELIPYSLLVSIIAARDSVPLPTIVELILMLFIFELIIEASRRLPSNTSQTVSIVGALVLGEAAVSARFISAPIIIITAITGTASFLLPSIGGPIIFIRVINLIFASFLGLYGFVFSISILTIYILSLRSFGVPYTLGLSTFNKYDIQDTIITVPWWHMKYRPRIIAAKNFIRQRNHKRDVFKR